MELVLLQMLQRRAAGSVDDALGHTGGAGGIQDVQGMVEREAQVRRRRAAMRTDERFPSRRADDGPFDGRKLLQHVGNLRALIKCLATVDVAVRYAQDARLDLAEAI